MAYLDEVSRTNQFAGAKVRRKRAVAFGEMLVWGALCAGGNPSLTDGVVATYVHSIRIHELQSLREEAGPFAGQPLRAFPLEIQKRADGRSRPYGSM